MNGFGMQTERIQGGEEVPVAIRAVLKYMGMEDFRGTISLEIGGGNGVEPMLVAAEMGKAVLDCDLMGRAYPNVSPHQLASRPCTINLRVRRGRFIVMTVGRCTKRKST